MPRSVPHVLVVAAAGYGKSTALDLAAPRDGLLCSAREALSGPAELAAHPWLGIDDLHELTTAEQQRLLTAVAALPPENRVFLTSRRPLRPDVAEILCTRVQQRGPQDLALSPYAVHRVLAEEYGVTDSELPLVVHRLTGGWPTLVQVAAETLVGGTCRDLEAALVDESSAMAAWLRREILAGLFPMRRGCWPASVSSGPRRSPPAPRSRTRWVWGRRTGRRTSCWPPGCSCG